MPEGLSLFYKDLNSTYVAPRLFDFSISNLSFLRCEGSRSLMAELWVILTIRLVNVVVTQEASALVRLPKLHSVGYGKCLDEWRSSTLRAPLEVKREAAD